MRAIEVPAVGGDTLFADMELAFENLSPAMKEWLCTLTATHDIARVFATRQMRQPKRRSSHSAILAARSTCPHGSGRQMPVSILARFW